MVDINLILLGAVCVVGLVDYIKVYDKESKLKKFYKVFALLISIVVSFGISLYVASALNVGLWIIYFLSTLSVATLAYENIVEWIQNKMKN